MRDWPWLPRAARRSVRSLCATACQQRSCKQVLAVRRALFSSAGPNLGDCGLFLANLQSNAVHCGFANSPSKQACWLASVLQPLAKRQRGALRMNNDASFFVHRAREFRRVGSRQPQISFCMALARRIRRGLWRTNDRAGLPGAPH